MRNIINFISITIVNLSITQNNVTQHMQFPLFAFKYSHSRINFLFTLKQLYNSTKSGELGGENKEFFSVHLAALQHRA